MLLEESGLQAAAWPESTASMELSVGVTGGNQGLLAAASVSVGGGVGGIEVGKKMASSMDSGSGGAGAGGAGAGGGGGAGAGAEGWASRHSRV